MLKTIATFKNKETRDFFFRKRIKQWEKVAKKALKVLFILNAVDSLKELEFSFDARLHKLHGDRKGQYAIRINTQYRILLLLKK